MDPCPFVRLFVESLTLKLPAVAQTAGPAVHPSATPCFCTLHLQDCLSSLQSTPLTLAIDPTSTTNLIEPSATSWSSSSSPVVVINLDPATLQRLSGKLASLLISVYAGRTGSTCGFSSRGRLLGKVRVPVDLEAAPTRATVAQNGWVSVGSGRTAAQLHLMVRSEPDPRFVFQFGGEPECSPVVYQIQGDCTSGGSGQSGSVRQPVFSCRFSTDRRRSTISTTMASNTSKERSTCMKGCWFGSFIVGKDSQRREQRKGWTVTIHDLSGCPVAAASVITPFVPSPCSDRVSRSNPGAWLILTNIGPSTAANWKPWGRLEVWRERGPVDALGYKFELVADAAAGPNTGVPIAESSLGVRKGGRFCIDPSVVHGGGHDSSGLWPFGEGFVMEATVEGQGKVSKPTVHVGVQHVTCMADVALFIALSAAVDLSMDACQLFSQKLRKELSQDKQEYIL